MRIKLDENMPRRLAKALIQMGHDADTVVEEGLAGQDDEAVWLAAQAAGRLLISQDLHFSDMRRFPPGTHHGILIVRLREPERISLIRYVSEAFRKEEASEWSGCLAVLTEDKVRILRPLE